MSYSTSFNEKHDFVGVIVVTGNNKDKVIEKLKQAIERLQEVKGSVSIASYDSIALFSELGKADVHGNRVHIDEVVNQVTIPKLIRDFDYNKKFEQNK